MDKDPKNLNPNNNPTPKHTDGGDDKPKNTFQISKDDWNKNQSTMQHLTNTVHNLSQKLETAHKSGNQPNSNDDGKQSSQDNDKYVSKADFKKLVDQNNQLKQSVQHKNHHADVLQHAKDTLKMNHMKVSPTTFSQLLGADNRSTDANINWFKGIYKKINSKPRRFPPANHHTNKEPSIGKQLVKDDKSDGAMRNIDDCFKN